MSAHCLFFTLFIIGLAALQPGSTLKCYQCSGEECKILNDKLVNCSTDAITSTSIQPTTISTTTTGSSTTSPTTSTSNPSTSDPATSSSSTSDPSTPSSSTSAPATSSSSTSSPATSSSSTSAPATSSSSTSAPATSSSSTSSPEASITTKSNSGDILERRRRSLVGRFLPVQLSDADEPKMFCFRETNEDEKINPKLGCTTDENYCGNKTNCKVCTEDSCNSAASNVVFISMIISFAVIALFAK